MFKGRVFNDLRVGLPFGVAFWVAVVAFVCVLGECVGMPLGIAFWVAVVGLWVAVVCLCAWTSIRLRFVCVVWRLMVSCLIVVCIACAVVIWWGGGVWIGLRLLQRQ